GTSASEILTGSIQADNIDGLEGDDTIIGGLGNDVLTGGNGKDVFVFDTTPGQGNSDTITDFNPADDTIQLSSGIFSALAIGALDINAFVTGSSANNASDRIIYNTSTGELFYDADGTGATEALLIATLIGTPTLDAASFVVV
ncbi:MAG: hemolysin, partial [Chlorobium sp.]